MADIIQLPGNLKKDDTEKIETTEREEHLKNQLRLLPQYRGEVTSKNNIRMLPNLKSGEIFWVSLDHAAYCVAAVSVDKKVGTKVVIKKLDDTATISTGLTVFDLNKGIISKEPLFDWSNTEEVEKISKRMQEWFAEDGDSFYLLYGRDIHYVTLFNCYLAHNLEGILDTIRDVLSAVGDVISIDFDTSADQHSVEIWIRTKDSPAELLYLMPFDRGVVEI